MTITERPPADHLRLELEQPAPGVLRLDVDTLDGPAVLGAGTGYAWTDTLASTVGTVSARRGGRAEGGALSVEVGTLTARLLDVASDDVRVGQRVRLVLADGRALFRGTVRTIALTESRDASGAWRTYTTLTATDAVAALVATTRYGAIVEHGHAAEALRARVQRLLGSLPRGIAAEPAGPGLGPLAIPASTTFTTVWAVAHGGAEAARWSVTAGSVDTAPDGRVRFQLDADGLATRQLTGLVPGRLYEIALGLSVDLPYGVDTPRPARRPGFPTTLRFIAQGSTATIAIGGPASVAHLDGINLGWWDAPTWACASTVLESSLATHLDRTLATAPGLGWYVSRDNVVSWLDQSDSVTAQVHLTDEADPTALHYVDLDRGTSTDELVTDAVIDAAQRGYDDSGTPVSADRTYGYTDAEAAHMWGGSTSTRATLTASDHDAAALAARMLQSRPRLTPTLVRWNAAEDVAALAQLEITAPVAVTRLGVRTEHRIAALTHEITPTRHIVTLDLMNKE